MARKRKHNPLVNPDEEPMALTKYRERGPVFSDTPWLTDYQGFNPIHPNSSRESVQALARKHTHEAILTLVYHMRNKYNPELSLEAAKTLMERGWGKAAQLVGVLDGGASEALARMSVEERIDYLVQAGSGPTPALPPGDAVDVSTVPQEVLDLV